ncbi:hypothetical protein C8R45DRAFT_570717 [Mycena sanguinolenta]|nr:hypothetical protein C8R45DRAFT_570717 [Mycena sanguinolenta]
MGCCAQSGLQARRRWRWRRNCLRWMRHGLSRRFGRVLLTTKLLLSRPLHFLIRFDIARPANAIAPRDATHSGMAGSTRCSCGIPCSAAAVRLHVPLLRQHAVSLGSGPLRPTRRSRRRSAPANILHPLLLPCKPSRRPPRPAPTRKTNTTSRRHRLTERRPCFTAHHKDDLAPTQAPPPPPRMTTTISPQCTRTSRQGGCGAESGPA